MSIKKRLGLFHTAAPHVPRFAALLRDLAPEVEAEHVVYEGLLAEARAQNGIDAVLAEAFAAALTGLAVSSAVILRTCSTFGAHAETSGRTLQKPVVRIDRPLAQAAVAAGSHVVIVAALSSTLEPT